MKGFIYKIEDIKAFYPYHTLVEITVGTGKNALEGKYTVCFEFTNGNVTCAYDTEEESQKEMDRFLNFHGDYYVFDVEACKKTNELYNNFNCNTCNHNDVLE